MALMRPLRPFAAAAALTLLTAAGPAAPPAAAGEPEPVEAYAEVTESSPFELEVTRAELVTRDDGSRALEFDYVVRNLSEERLVGFAWGLEIHDAGGELTAGAGASFSADLPPGGEGAHTYAFDAQATAAVDPAGLLVLTTAGGSFSYHGLCPGSATSEEEACGNWAWACEMHCGAHNPLVGGPGVASSSCGGCRQLYDEERECWFLSCQSTCICESWEFPPYMPAGEGPWVPDPGVLGKGPVAEPVGEDGFFFWRN